ncbi:MAG TPA: AraC family transcriptional regulator [Verrucomicrobiae bacterium]|nr:AraC family transcriptional regulator [Verrucomicrobiae bacterium]
MQDLQKSREDIRLGAGQTFRLLRWQGNVGSVEEIKTPTLIVPLPGHGDHWHYHRETELTYFKRGSGTRFIADHIELFEAEDIVLIGTNVPHYWHSRGASAGLSIQWDFPFEHGLWTFGEASPLHSLAEAARYGLHLSGSTAEQARRSMEQLATLSGLRRLAAFLDLLGLLATAPARNVRQLAAQPFSLSGTDEHQEVVQRAVSYVLANYREQIRLGELLRLTGMSRASFARQFRTHAGKSFSTFLNQVRLQAVCRSLRNTTEPVSTIALNNGFNQLSFFNRLFRREFGLNPTEYRKASGSKRLSAMNGRNQVD